MLKHAVLKNWHPMVGADRHVPWPPGSPAPAPAPVFYVAFSVMWGLSVVASYAKDVSSNYHGLTMLKVTDIGPMIPHVGPPSVLMALEIPLSSSKSYFGSSRYVSQGKPIAVALLLALNPNLNCGTPLPTPTGCAIGLTTHWVDMSWGDILSGLLQMCCDIAIMWALSKLGKVGTPAFNFLQRKLYQRFLPGALAAFGAGGDEGLRLAWAGVQAASQAEGKTKLLNWAIVGGVTVVGLLIGSPMGVDAATAGLYGKYSGDHPGVGASKGDHRGGPGDMTGGLLGGMADDSGQALGSYLDGGNPKGYPKDIGSKGVTD